MEIAVQDFDRDLPTVRIYELDNNKVYLTREDPYGFWRFNLERGQLPDKLKGAQYTSASEAEKALAIYLRERGKEVLVKTI